MVLTVCINNKSFIHSIECGILDIIILVLKNNNLT